MKKFFFIISVFFSVSGLARSIASNPKVVIIIVADQFPYEYISRFEPYFSGEGFNYLFKNGANFINAQHKHAYTKTGPGHAAIITGAYSHINGIIANRWYDRKIKKVIEYVEDESTNLVGSSGEGCSPKNLRAYTIGDMLRIHTNFRSKVISISNKDRAAVLMGGKFGSAFWFKDSLIVTSSYYFNSVPSWMKEFNSLNPLRNYFGKEWSEALPTVAALICDKDEVPYETNISGFGTSFPHIVGAGLKEMTPVFYQEFEASPFATDRLFEAVRKVFIAESLGKRNITDMLCIGISATDEIGHLFGPQSHEVFDNVIRTDKMLAEFFSFLAKNIGLDECLIAFTSDHGVAPIPGYLRSRSPNIETGNINSIEISSIAETVLTRQYGKTKSSEGWIQKIIDGEIYLNRDILFDKNILLESALNTLKDSLAHLPFIAGVYTRSELDKGDSKDKFAEKLLKTYYPLRSGDLFLILQPYFVLSSDKNGTNHGQPYSYDSHVPLVLMGKNINPGIYINEVQPIDLAPTLALLLGIEFPPACEGSVLTESLKIRNKHH